MEIIAVHQDNEKFVKSLFLKDTQILIYEREPFKEICPS
jgi:hypothetical protein